MNGRNLAIAGGVATVAIVAAILFSLPSGGPEWGLHIVVLDVGQADAIAMVSADGDACVIDAGIGSSAGRKVAAFLKEADSNGVGEITEVKLGFATHYDRDHIGGFKTIAAEGIEFGAIYDQGLSQKREGKSVYEGYVSVTGDSNDNMAQDPGEDSFVRKEARVGLHWTLGEARIRCVSVRGDTRGSAHDLPLDPSEDDINENPGSIALLVTLGEFEFYTAGDQTSDDWKHEPDTEIAVVRSGVIGVTADIDVLKVNHHGSDTSTGQDFVLALDPEVAIISAKYTSVHKLPKMISVKELVENGALVYVTGDGHNPDTGTFTDSRDSSDDGYIPPAENVINQAGNVHIFVAEDGSSYRVVAGGVWKEFSTVDSVNVHLASLLSGPVFE